jgi:DNA polymerase elongation subunit (family B)
MKMLASKVLSYIQQKQAIIDGRIASFDFNSLYPNVMMTVNISPDTKVGKVISNEEDTNVSIRKTNGQIVTITKAQFAELLDKKCTISANKVLYVKPSLKMGIIGNFLDSMYSQRVATKGLMKKNKKKAQELEKEIQKLEEELKNLE